MKNDSENNTILKYNASFTETLFIIFLILKLTNTVDWSWWYVTMPLWINLVLVPVFILTVVGVSIPIALVIEIGKAAVSIKNKVKKFFSKFKRH
jgi:hypothetical protein